MPENTPKLNIPKPLGNEYFNRTNFNDILDAIDVGAAAEVHTHAISAITGLQTALDGKAPTSHTHPISQVTNLQTSLDGKAPTSHTHAISDVTGLQTALDGKAPTSHTHSMSNVTGLITALDGKASAADVGNKAELTTTDKTNLVAAINEVKFSANDIKSKWSSVVGSPLSSSDTSDTLQSKTQTIKNTLATNLTNKGQSANGSETLTSLINKVAGISTGKKFATGTGFAEGPAQTFVLLTAINQTGTISRRYAQASGLGFTPSFILVVGEDISGAVPEKRHMTIFNANINAFAATNGDIVSVNTVAQAGQSPVVTTTVYALGEAGYVNSTGFRLPLDVRTANPITWFAFE